MQINEYNQLKRSVEDRKREYDREVGAFKQVMSQLKEEFGCKTLEDAKRLLNKKERQLKTSEREFDRNLKRFLKKHRGLIRN